MNSNSPVKMKRSFLSSILFVLLFSACSVSETKKDNQIDPQIKKEIHVLNNRIVDGIVENNISRILPDFDDRLKDNKKVVLQLMEVVKGALKVKDYRILNEFYQKNAAKKGIASVSSGTGNLHDYQLTYDSHNKEMYVITSSFEDSVYQKSFTFVYAKQGNRWKLNNLQAGVLKITRKDAIDWYQQAKTEYKKGYLMDAMCHVNLATRILNPANHMWQYNKGKEIQLFERQITKQIYSKYHFPFTVTDVPSKPVIYRVYSEVAPNACFPLVIYTTSVDLNDMSALGNECKAIHKSIGTLFHGLDTNNDMILYKPLKSIPTGTNPENLNDHKSIFLVKTH